MKKTSVLGRAHATAIAVLQILHRRAATATTDNAPHDPDPLIATIIVAIAALAETGIEGSKERDRDHDPVPVHSSEVEAGRGPGLRFAIGPSL